MKERKTIDFMSKLSGESNHPFEPSDQEEEALEAFWKENLADAPSETMSDTECDRFRERLQAYEEGLFEASRFHQDKNATSRKLSSRWPVLVTAIAAMLALAFGVDQFNYHSSLKTQHMSGEIAQLKEMLALTLIRQNTATDRIDGVVLASDVQSPDPMLVDELIRMLNSDPSVNVRLAALKALDGLSDSPSLRESLMQAIPNQTSSLVTLNICKLLMQNPRPEEYPVLIEQLEKSGLGADYLEHFRKTLQPRI